MDDIKSQIAMENALKRIARKIQYALIENFGVECARKIGFALLVFEFNKPGIGNYVSNASRESIIKTLRETATRLEKEQDIPPGYKTIQ